MAKYDLEMLLADIETVLTTNLNGKITALNTEKGDSITLAQVDSAAYVLQTMNAQVLNYDPFIIYGVDDIQTEGLGPCSLDEYTIRVVLVLSDSGQDLNISKRMLRYLRVLRDTIESNFTNNRHGLKLTVSSLVPVPITNLNGSQKYQAVGISLKASLA